jgi:hypothetical protein
MNLSHQARSLFHFGTPLLSSRRLPAALRPPRSTTSLRSFPPLYSSRKPFPLMRFPTLSVTTGASRHPLPAQVGSAMHDSRFTTHSLCAAPTPPPFFRKNVILKYLGGGGLRRISFQRTYTRLTSLSYAIRGAGRKYFVSRVIAIPSFASYCTRSIPLSAAVLPICSANPAMRSKPTAGASPSCATATSIRSAYHANVRFKCACSPSKFSNASLHAATTDFCSSATASLASPAASARKRASPPAAAASRGSASIRKR